jgi:hypothetical protein
LVPTLKIISPGKSYAAAAENHTPESTTNGNHDQKNTMEQAPKKCSDNDMANLYCLDLNLCLQGQASQYLVFQCLNIVQVAYPSCVTNVLTMSVKA